MRSVKQNTVSNRRRENKRVSEVQFDSIVDRLYTFWKIYQDRMEKRKYKHEEELLETNTFRPEISENSKNIMSELSKKHYKDELAAKYLPIYNDKRLKEIENHKKMKMERIKDELAKRDLKLKEEEDEILRIVAAKTSSSKYNQKEIMENIEVRCKQYLDKKNREKEEKEAKFSEITFTPVISDRSKNILKKKGGAKTFRERQIEFENRNLEKKKKLEQQMQPSFKPAVNPRSKLTHKKGKADVTDKNMSRNKHGATKSFENLQVKNQYKYIEASKRIHEEIPEVEDEESSNLHNYNNKISLIQNEEIKEISDFINGYKRVNIT